MPINTKPKRGKQPGPEKSIQDTILAWLRLNGCLAIRVNQGGFVDKRGHYVKFTDEEGVSDIIACVPREFSNGDDTSHHQGLFVAIECKAIPGEAPSDKQSIFIEKVKDADGWAFVAYSLECVQKVLHWLPHR